MTLDRLCYLLLFSLLLLLCLPQFLLWTGLVWACLLIVMSLWKRSWALFVAALLISLSYARVIDFAEKVGNQTAYTITETVSIRQILKQNDYQSAIAERANGERLHLVWQSKTALQFGAQYHAELRLRPISSRLNEGNFNRQRWLLAQHIQATATVKNATLINAQPDFRQTWLNKAVQQTEGLSTQGIILALAFGERAWLSSHHWQLFQQTATAHLIAISGLHIALAFAIGFWATNLILGGLSWLLHRYRLKQAVENPHFFALFIGFCTACLYSFLAGFAVPTTRALLAISLVLACRWQRRYYTAWQLWLRGVLLLVLVDPLTLLSDSFWLSILAVACLIFWYHYFPIAAFPHIDEWRKRSKVGAFLLNLVHLQIGITLCFLPVQLYFFEGSSPYAFVANLMIVPFYSLLVVPLILAGLLGAELLPFWAMVDLLLQASLTLISALANEWQTLSRAAQWQWLSLDLFLLGLIYFRARLKSAFSLLVVVSLAFSQLPKGWQALFEPPDLEWIHFDVGQGLAMAFVIQTSGQKQAIIYDTGAAWQGGSMAELEIVPYLKRQGIDIAQIIISHDDNDHSGGAKALLHHFPNAGLTLSGENRYSDASFIPCVTGQQWQFGKLHLQALYPPVLAKRAKNEDSCVLLGTINGFKFLLTGDSGTAQEQQFSAQIGKLDILQVGHHGSKTSTSYTLLAQTQPQYAIISAGRFNPWKMPSLSVVSRLAQFQISHFNTAQSGMITFQFYPDRYEIYTARDRFSPWYEGFFGQ